jgi:uncharacterized protein YoxC
MTAGEIIWLVVAVFIVLLIIFIIKFLIDLSKTQKSVDLTLGTVQKQINNLGDEPRDLIHNANQITSDIHHKMKCLNPLFHTVSNVGENFEYQTSNLKERSYWRSVKEKIELEEPPSTPTDKASDLANWALMGLKVWQNFRK